MARYDVSAPGGAPVYINYTHVYEHPRSPTVTLEDDRSMATATVDVDWADAPSFGRAILGYSNGYTPYSSVGVFINRKIPWGFPFVRGFGTRKGRPFMWASKAQISGYGVPTTGATYSGADERLYPLYKKARFTVDFTTRTYELITDDELKSRYGGDEGSFARFVTKIVKPSGEFLSLDSGAWWYHGSRAAPSQGNPNPGADVVRYRGLQKLIVSYNIAFTWHNIPIENVPSKFFNPTATNNAIDRCIGRVNSATFAGYPVGTMLLMAVEFKPIISPLGDRNFDIFFMFKFFNPTTTLDLCGNSVGHNHAFYARNRTNQSQNTWYEIGTDGGLALLAPPNCTNLVTRTENVNIYNYAAMNYLFRPAQAAAAP